MKKFYLIALAALTTLGAAAIDKQVYDQLPDYFPSAFQMNMTRNDYLGTDDEGQPVLVNQQNCNVKWEPEYVNQSGCYGRLVIENFYAHEAINQTATVQFTNENNLNFLVSEDGSTITFSFTGYYVGDAVSEYSSAYGYPFSKCALLARGRKGSNNRTSRFWVTGDYTAYAYNGGSACECVLNLSNNTITIDNIWGAFMCSTNYGASPSYVLEVFDSSTFEPTEISGVTEIKTPQPATDDPYYYTIAGQRTLTPASGLYIHQGKKVLVK